MKIEQRRNTTRTGLEQLKKLVYSFDFEKDIETIRSNHFSCKTWQDNGLFTNDFNYVEWQTDSAYIRIKDGQLDIIAVHSRTGEKNVIDDEISDITYINFAEFTECFVKLLENYNNLSEEKDTEIERFINIVANFQEN